MQIDVNVIKHEKDKVSTDQLKEGKLLHWVWNKLVKKLLPDEQLAAGIGSYGVQISDTVVPELYHLLQDISAKMEIEIPHLYIQNIKDDFETYYAKNVYIVLKPSYLKSLPKELYQTVLVRECSHLLGGTSQLRSMSGLVLKLVQALEATPIGTLAKPLDKVLSIGRSNSELTADRMAMVYNKGSKELLELCYREAGYYNDMIPDEYMEAFKQQAMKYKDTVSEIKTKRMLEQYGIADADHPSFAERISSALEWEKTDDFRKTVELFWDPENAKEVKLCYSSDDLKNMDLKEARGIMEIARFKNVEVLDNTGKPSASAEGKVKEVEINGKTAFEEKLWYPSDSKVIIRLK